MTRSCRANNISGERVFAKHDASQHRAPSGKADYHESKVLYSSNKTRDWLAEQDRATKKHLIGLAWQQRSNVSKDTKETEKEVQSRRRELLQAKEASIIAKAEKGRMQMEHLLGALFRIGGLWQHTQVVEVEDQMKALKLRSHAKQLNALKTQIKARKVILYDEHEERIFVEFDEVLTDLKCVDLQIM